MNFTLSSRPAPHSARGRRRGWFYCRGMVKWLTRLAHNQVIAGSSPAPASSPVAEEDAKDNKANGKQSRCIDQPPKLNGIRPLRRRLNSHNTVGCEVHYLKTFAVRVRVPPGYTAGVAGVATLLERRRWLLVGLNPATRFLWAA